jgi:hypothetical protein
MAQRRTREGALFQCALALSWDPDRMASLLGLGPDAAVDLARAVHPVGAGGAGGAVGAVNADDCAMALLDHFPDGA